MKSYFVTRMVVKLKSHYSEIDFASALKMSLILERDLLKLQTRTTLWSEKNRKILHPKNDVPEIYGYVRIMDITGTSYNYNYRSPVS